MKIRLVIYTIIALILAMFITKNTGTNKLHEITFLKEANEQQRLEIVALKYELKLAKMYEANRQSLCKR